MISSPRSLLLPVLVLMAHVAAPGRRDAVAQPASLRASISVRPTPYFEGEPIYLLVTVHNAGPLSQAVPTVAELSRESEVAVRSTSGADTRRSWTFIDVLGGGATDTLAPGETLDWIVPVHWYWGSRVERTAGFSYYALAPGEYAVSIVFPDRYSIAPDTVRLRVRARTPEEDRARWAFLAGVPRALSAARDGGDAALNALMRLHRDTLLAPYTTQLLCDVAGAMEAVGAHLGRFPSVVDSLRAGRALAMAGGSANQVRLIQSIADERLDLLVAVYPALRSVGYVNQRLRLSRAERSRRP